MFTDHNNPVWIIYRLQQNCKQVTRYTSYSQLESRTSEWIFQRFVWMITLKAALHSFLLLLILVGTTSHSAWLTSFFVIMYHLVVLSRCSLCLPFSIQHHCNQSFQTKHFYEMNLHLCDYIIGKMQFNSFLIRIVKNDINL